jgi:hypothetical protein
LWVLPEYSFLGAIPDAAIYDPSESQAVGSVQYCLEARYNAFAFFNELNTRSTRVFNGNAQDTDTRGKRE